MKTLLEAFRRRRERAIWQAGVELYRQRMAHYGRETAKLDDEPAMIERFWRLAESEMWVIRFEKGRPSKMRADRSVPPGYRYEWGRRRQLIRKFETEELPQLMKALDG